ncbi:MAG: AmmeMemoRadiSam system protein A, partial [Magnetococcales bacterium]|nr:AmmeMemoRadiSam system protein A [Magnetococcales bacterium]
HLHKVLSGQTGLSPNQLETNDPSLATPGATFVTLTKRGQLRGCIGSLQAYRPLSVDLLQNAMAAALRDSRFSPVTAGELADIAIEVSLLTKPEPFPYENADDLLQRLKPGVHGVILNFQGNRATFLPQVWQQLRDPVTFLSHLCRKAGAMGDCWQRGAKIEVYTVQEFHEGGHG